LTQCFNPPRDDAPTDVPEGYKTFKVDGITYLLNKTTGVIVVVPTAAASTAAQSITPVDLSKDSFSVTPSVTKKRSKKSEGSSSSVVLAEHERSDDAASNDSSVIYVRVKKRKKTSGASKKTRATKPVDLVVSSQQPSSSGVDAEEDEIETVVDDLVVVPTVSSEVETQALPETADFCEASKAKAQEEEDDDLSQGDPMSDLSQNLLEDDGEDDDEE
jgi:hypothetical protein